MNEIDFMIALFGTGCGFMMGLFVGIRQVTERRNGN